MSFLPHNIIILGPTSTGKSDLANFIASNRNIPIFNCDSVQIYKDLNYLSNKPKFASQEVIDGNQVSYIKPLSFIDTSKYSNIEFKIIRRKFGKIILNKCLDNKEFFRWIVDMNLVANEVAERPSLIETYLFDIKEPGETYSVAEFIGQITKNREQGTKSKEQRTGRNSKFQIPNNKGQRTLLRQGSGGQAENKEQSHDADEATRNSLTRELFNRSPHIPLTPFKGMSHMVHAKDTYRMVHAKGGIPLGTAEQPVNSIIVGGTIYYAYHYILGSQFDSNYTFYEERDRYGLMGIEELVEFLREHDPEVLNLTDVTNKSRLIKAVSYIRKTGKKYSETYFKDTNVLDDFLLILLYPKDREEYCRKLDNIVEKRMNEDAMTEIEFLIKKYGDGIKDWLKKVSYEYKYAVDIYESASDVSKSALLEELKAKERQYTKRQVTFMKKLEKDLADLLDRPI